MGAVEESLLRNIRQFYVEVVRMNRVDYFFVSMHITAHSNVSKFKGQALLLYACKFTTKQVSPKMENFHLMTNRTR